MEKVKITNVELSPTYCVLPWTHILINSSGNVRPCCAANGASDNLGHLSEQTLKEIWNGEEMRQLRLDMLEGRKNSKCQLCHHMDSQGLFSLRKESNKLFSEYHGRVANTHEDGSLPEEYSWVYLEPQFSNVCNLRCRMCNPMYSTSWQKDLEYSEFKDGTYEIEHAFSDFEVFWKQIAPDLDQLDRLHFTGGEPLLMEGHYRLLEKLLLKGRRNVVLNYHTNLSHLEFKGWNISELWEQFDRVTVCVSMDAVKDRFEYIRKGADWKTVRENLKVLQVQNRKLWFEIYPTISVFNFWHLPDMLTDLIEMGLLTYKRFRCKVLADPDFMSIQVFPPEFKKEIHRRWDEFFNRENIRCRSDFQFIKDQIDGYLRFMDNEDHSHLLPCLYSKTEELDRIRKESLYDSFPELHWLKEFKDVHRPTPMEQAQQPMS